MYVCTGFNLHTCIHTEHGHSYTNASQRCISFKFLTYVLVPKIFQSILEPTHVCDTWNNLFPHNTTIVNVGLNVNTYMYICNNVCMSAFHVIQNDKITMYVYMYDRSNVIQND